MRFASSHYANRILIYGALISWAFVCLFPIYWTVSTSFKTAPNVMQGALLPWVDFEPDWKGWRSLGLSPDTIGQNLDGARRVPQALRQQHRQLGQRIVPGGL